MSPACGPPRSLSPEKQTSAAPARDRAAHRRLVGERREVVGEHARADVVDHRDAERAQRLDLDLLDEADACGSSTGGRAGSRRVSSPSARGVVGEPRAVRRADLDQPRARPGR